MIKVVCGVIFFNKRVLIAQNGSSHKYSNLWEFPGGKIEGNETNFDAIKREIKEELSLEVSPLFCLKAIEFSHISGDISLQPIFCTTSSHLFSLHVHDAARWVSIGDLGCYELAPTDKRIVEIYWQEFVRFI